jgi:hypothetical protein
MAATQNIKELFNTLKSTPSIQSASSQAVTLYYNKQKADALFKQTFAGISKIVQTVEEADETEIKMGGEVSVGTGIMQWFLNLKASLTGAFRRGETEKTIIEREVTGIWRMALAEAVLQREGHIQDVRIGEKLPFEKPYLRLHNVFKPFEQKRQEDLKAELKKILGEEGAAAVAKRKKSDEEKHPGFSQFVYAANDPLPMASILFVPPVPDLEIVGDTWACYPPNKNVSRIYFGRPRDEPNGVTFIELMYVLEIPQG